MKKRSTRQILTTISNPHLTNTTIESLTNIFKCSRCNKYNNIMQPLIQNCLFCGNPNYVKVK
jgi:tRNA G26 N,N-dimethylase Trm1